MPWRRDRSHEVKDPESYVKLPLHAERWGELFDTLDKDKNGRINAKDIMEVFRHIPEESIKESIENADIDDSGNLDFVEFVNYVLSHEKKLAVVFGKLDQNKDGKLDRTEVVNSFQKFGINITPKEAERLLKRLDSDGSLAVSFDEFRDFFLWYPSITIQDLFGYWRHGATYLDLGEDALVPTDFTKKEMVTGMWWRHLVAGGVAGCVSRTCTAPLDRIKTFFQVYGRSGQCESLLKCFFSMLKEGGYWSLWRGNGMNVLKIAPESAIKFASYEQMKKIIKGKSERELYLSERILAGSMAGAMSQSAIYPMEVIKTRLTLGTTGQFDGIFHAARRILKNEGLSAFYRGYAPNLAGILPYAGIDLAVYESLKRWYLRRHLPSKDAQPPALVVLACGMVSSVCGQVSSYPLALVKTRLQAYDGPVFGAENGTIAVIKNIVNTEGIPGLYRGMGPNFLKAVPAVSISYVVYEHVREALGGHMT
ncbi:calcium-binding mitochondrial carrier protein SCaMC-3-like isoform X2 [Paramacrobiotus metropolitanus]|uniref:calcium-binding mitochondrial carrier protein SCaMC-3-like isoform X2 n=1 Tax=Paramacrobiotus metropolitanus TaxID=2943436 RepID=UPI002445F68B|nr:calcium-binding mitochondrial carrier protein SCaMC-3-like isoform X2 [Paramacrobiotus metropolitanus]